MMNEPVGPYGTEAEAREYAEDLGAGYCSKCMAVYHVEPYLPNDGHECLTDGTADAYLLGD